jgi:two-component system nitrate/nitrite response regulator NarL
MSEGSLNVLVVVEDDPDMRRLIRYILAADERLNVTGEATTAEEAVRLARELDPALIVLDHFLVGPVTGLKAAPMLREAAPRARIILFSSHDLTVEASQEPSVDVFLSKRQVGSLLGVALELLGLQ